MPKIIATLIDTVPARSDARGSKWMVRYTRPGFRGCGYFQTKAEALAFIANPEVQGATVLADDYRPGESRFDYECRQAERRLEAAPLAMGAG